MAMLSSLLSPTRVLSFDELSPEDFVKAIDYLGRRPRRVALVVDKRPFPERDRLAAAARSRFDTVLLDAVSPDPLCSDIDGMLGGGALEGVELVVGIGGGSVLDTAKALAVLARAGGRLEDYLGASPSRRLEAKGPPLLLLPTTAGTGSEVTKVGVYRDGTGRKHSLGSPFLQADAALLVGSLAVSMPPALAASTGFDALSHALESLWNRNATGTTAEAAVEAAIAVMRRLPPAYEAAKAVESGASTRRDATSRAAARGMLEASTMAGFAFSITGTAMVHALSFVLTEEWRVPHGTACAFALEDGFRLALGDPEVRKSLARIGDALFLRDGQGVSPGAAPASADGAELLLGKILELKAAMGLPSSFADLGVVLPRDRVRSLFARAFDDPKMANTRPAADPDAVYAFLEAKAR